MQLKILIIIIATSALIGGAPVIGAVLLNETIATSRFKPVTDGELIAIAHHILDMGFDCHSSGAERVACHAQLTTAINKQTRGRS